MTKKVLINEVALRDGSHVVAHSYTVEQVEKVVSGLSAAGVPYIEVTHGDGLGGSSLQYGLSAVDEFKLIEKAVEVAGNSKISVLSLPGIGTVELIERAKDIGAKMVRIATHVTEADVSKQHIEFSKELGLETVGFLMMAHMGTPETIVEQAKLMESYGADIIYVTDSAGALIPTEVTARISRLRQELKPEVEIGFHGHNNLSLALANTLAAIDAGATRVDGSIRCLGAGAGNTQTEVLVCVLEKLGIETGVDIYKLLDVAEEVVAPLLPVPQEITRDSLLLGYLGLYSSFLLHSKKAADRYQIAQTEVLKELGKHHLVGGQEDMIYDIASQMV